MNTINNAMMPSNNTPERNLAYKFKQNSADSVVKLNTGLPKERENTLYATMISHTRGSFEAKKRAIEDFKLAENPQKRHCQFSYVFDAIVTKTQSVPAGMTGDEFAEVIDKLEPSFALRKN